MNMLPPPVPREQLPTYRQLIDDSRADLARIKARAEVLLALRIYPHGHFAPSFTYVNQEE